MFQIIGVNVRSGPGTDYSIVRAVPNGYRGVRIETGKDYNNNYWWDKVIFDDGTFGYVASIYLKKID